MEIIKNQFKKGKIGWTGYPIGETLVSLPYLLLYKKSILIYGFF
jgi:hypothetical protein